MDTDPPTSNKKSSRAEKYLAGVARCPYRLAPSIESALVSPAATHLVSEDAAGDCSEETSAKRAKRASVCAKGCHVPLRRLAVAYSNIGVHTGRTALYRRRSYPNPKKASPPRNIKSKVYVYNGCAFYHCYLFLMIEQNQWIRENLLEITYTAETVSCCISKLGHSDCTTKE